MYFRNDPEVRDAIAGKLFLSFRRQESLNDMLVHRKHNSMFCKIRNGSFKCTKKKCIICEHLKEGASFQDNDGNAYVTKGNITCSTSNLIYGIHCTKCNGLLNVGETMTTLYKRHIQNFSRVRTAKDSDDISKHFSQGNHDLSHYKIVGIEKIFKEDSFRKAREVFWMKKLKTVKPHGLNCKTA